MSCSPAFPPSESVPSLVVVVDDDIDPRDPVTVEWAIATRFQADQDLLVIPRQAGAPLDPSTPAPRLGAIMGIDATRPYGKGVSRSCHGTGRR